MRTTRGNLWRVSLGLLPVLFFLPSRAALKTCLNDPQGRSGAKKSLKGQVEQSRKVVHVWSSIIGNRPELKCGCSASICRRNDEFHRLGIYLLGWGCVSDGPQLNLRFADERRTLKVVTLAPLTRGSSIRRKRDWKRGSECKESKAGSLFTKSRLAACAA